MKIVYLKIVYLNIVIDGMSDGVPSKECVCLAKAGGFLFVLSALNKDH